MPNPYTASAFDCAAGYYRVHGNSEQTHVAVLRADEGHWLAVAYDIDPAEYEPIAAECIGYGPTKADATARAERWMETNPKGVAPNGGGGSSIGSRIVGGLKRLAEWGQEMNEQQQTQGNGGGNA